MSEVNILAEQKPKTIILADGKEYNLPPIDLTTLANIEKTMGFGLSVMAMKMEAAPMSTIRNLIFALLKEARPDLTIEQVGRLITLNEMKTIATTISEIMAVSG